MAANSRSRSNSVSPPLDSAAVDAFMRKRVVVIAAALVAMLIAAGGAWFAIAAMSNGAASMAVLPSLPIRSVTFTGVDGELKRVEAGELKRIAGAIQNIGGSMLKTDLNQVKAAVREVEWVRDAEVRRRFPSTLEVRIEEHAPFARWQSAGDVEQTLLVNTAGEIFAAEFDGALPVFSGPKDSARQVLIQYLSFRTQLAPLDRAPAELHLSARRAWQLKFDNGTTLELGRSDADQRLARYVRAYPAIAALRNANVRVDMRYSAGLAVRAAATNANDPAASRAAIKAITKS